jgi:cobalt-zinc-cadmium efflux system outer membrane protein
MAARHIGEQKQMKWLVTIFLLILLPASGLAQTKPPSADVSKEVEARTGHKLNPGAKVVSSTLPEGVSLDDGLTEDEAVAIALWNNGALQAELAALGLARADIIEAGQLRNPSLTVIFPFSTRILEAVANWPFEALWQRPKRVAAAKLDLERLEETLISRALDLVRDVRLAYADYAAAQMRASVATEAVRERREIATIVNARFRAGDISELETSASVVDARLAEEQAARFTQEVMLAKERLRALLGFGSDGAAFDIIAPSKGSASNPTQPISVKALPASPPAPSATSTSETLDELIKQAFDARPELKAAELAIEAAGQRAKWERSRIHAVSAIAKEYGRGAGGFEQGPGVQIELPIFNRNKGGISRAEAEIERAARQLIAARQRVVAEVREAYTQLLQAREAHQLWRTRLLPPLEEDIRSAERAYRAGDVSYLFVLETTRRLTDARLREAEFQATTARAVAQLERSVGRRLFANR